MKCALKNFCEKKFLCCHYCTNKRCWQRCTDKNTQCGQYCPEIVLISDLEAVNTPPKGLIHTKTIRAKKRRKNRKVSNI